MTSEPHDKPTIWQHVRRIAVSLIRWSLFILTAYLVAILIGLIPVNWNFAPATGPDAVPVFVFSGPVHSDLILPVRTETIDWRDEVPSDSFVRNCDGYSHISIGWGDRGFYLHTPTWRELKASTAINAMLLPSDSVVHVQFLNEPLQSAECRKVQISKEQYKALAEFVLKSFARTNDAVIPIPGEAYLETDAFFEGVGSYHALNTCNCWAARGLVKSHVKAPWFAPLPRTILWYLPSKEGTAATE